MKNVSLRMVAIIDGKMIIPIKDINFTQTIADEIKDKQCEDIETKIVEYLSEIVEEFYDKLSNESNEFHDDDAKLYIDDYHI